MFRKIAKINFNLMLCEMLHETQRNFAKMYNEYFCSHPARVFTSVKLVSLKTSIMGKGGWGGPGCLGSISQRQVATMWEK